jgi:hypothetical protein
MGLQRPSTQQLQRLMTEEEKEQAHLSQLERGIFAKTTLTTFHHCRHKFYLRYIRRVDDYWGPDLIEGIAGHTVLELFHAKLLKGETPYPVELREAFVNEVKRLATRLEPGNRIDVGESERRILPLIDLYRDNWTRWMPADTVEAVEQAYGTDGDIELGGVKVACHADLVTKPRVVDFKIVGSRSQYRRRQRLDLGMEINVHCAGKQKSALLPMVKDYKRAPTKVEPNMAVRGTAVIDGLNEVEHSPDTKRVIELQVHDMAAAIQRGDFDQSYPEIGSGLCQPKYCSYFGRGCKYTNHLNRKAWLQDS